MPKIQNRQPAAEPPKPAPPADTAAQLLREFMDFQVRQNAILAEAMQTMAARRGFTAVMTVERDPGGLISKVNVTET